MIINGKEIAESILLSLKEKISQIEGRKPGIAFILIGDHPASQTYVKMKKKACEKTGIYSHIERLSDNISEEELISIIKNFNQDPKIDGILVQQPLPEHINTDRINECISPNKDVDGFHPTNVGRLLLGYKHPLIACTPKGIFELIKRSHIDLAGKHVLIIGRSNIVGKPLAALLMQKYPGANATVTIAHSRTNNLQELSLSADVIITALGKPRFLTATMVKKGAVVVDVGINRIEKDGKTVLVGDADFENLKDICSHITPVPKGVGPMTIAMLMQNGYECFLKNS